MPWIYSIITKAEATFLVEYSYTNYRGTKTWQNCSRTTLNHKTKTVALSSPRPIKVLRMFLEKL